jgi:hypothetical protein
VGFGPVPITKIQKSSVEVLVAVHSRTDLDRDIVAAAIPLFREALALELYLDHWHAVVITPTGASDRVEQITRKISREEYFDRPPHPLSICVPAQALDFSQLDEADRASRRPDIEARKWYFGSEDRYPEGAVILVNRWVDCGNCPSLFVEPNLDLRTGHIA